jgi:hypothetical protein
MDAMEAFEDPVELEVATGEIGRGREAVEIVGAERDCAIRARESGVGVSPRVTPVTCTAVVKMIHIRARSGRPCAGQCRKGSHKTRHVWSTVATFYSCTISRCTMM